MTEKSSIEHIEWRLDTLEEQIKLLCQEKDKLRNMVTALSRPKDG